MIQTTTMDMMLLDDDDDTSNEGLIERDKDQWFLLLWRHQHLFWVLWTMAVSN